MVRASPWRHRQRGFDASVKDEETKSKQAETRPHAWADAQQRNLTVAIAAEEEAEAATDKLAAGRKPNVGAKQIGLALLIDGNERFAARDSSLVSLL